MIPEIVLERTPSNDVQPRVYLSLQPFDEEIGIPADATWLYESPDELTGATYGAGAGGV